MSIVHPVPAANRPEILAHLLRLSPEDRRLRFGGPSSDETLAAYVARIDFARDTALGLRDDADALIGFTHVAGGADGAIELGLSVVESHRGQGLAQQMFQRAVLHARNRGIGELYMHCLSENAAMMHIARRAGMRIVIDGPERDAYLSLPPATPMSVGEEFLEGQLVLLDRALASAVRHARFRLATEPA